MSGKQAFDRKVEQLQSLRADPQSAATGEALRKALRDRSNYLVAKAAGLAGEFDRQDLVADLVTAFGRFFEDAAKTDPQCWAKNAIAKVLKDWAYEDPQLYLRGMHHFQPEPTYGGSEDTAAPLRGTCAFGLIQCRAMGDLDILRQLTDLLADPERGARMDAARAISQLGRMEGALLLRLKLHVGDAEPAVLGQCMVALMELSVADGIALVAARLDHADEDIRFEAAAALGECREPEAFQALRQRFLRAREPRFREALLASIGASRQDAAVDYLISLIEPGNRATAVAAIKALAPLRFREEAAARVQAAVNKTESEELARAFQASFER